MKRAKANMFWIREWAGSGGKRFWATIRWNAKPSGPGITHNAIEYADTLGACLDCDSAPTRKGAERIGRAYAKRLGLALPRVKHG